VGFAKITRDITERKAARDDLRRSEEQFRLLVQGIIDYAIYMLDPSGRVTSWNSGAQHLKGYVANEFLGEPVSRVYIEEDRQTGIPERALETAAREGRFAFEGWRVRKDGSRFLADVVLDAIHDEAGDLIGFAKITRDMTERQKVQEELEASRSRLHQSQKMEMIGQLTGGIAHDFNNLLSVILGNLDLCLKRAPDDGRLRRLLTNSIEAAKRGAALTQRMLAFARRQELKSEAVDVGDLVRGMSDLLERSLGSTIQVDTNFPLRLEPVLVDGNQLELAILNLVINARDAMPNGRKITIAASQVPHDIGGLGHECICLSVTDTGEGMDDETLAKAVEPFFTTKGIGRGTGLGLSMIHGFANQSNGRLILKSRPGEGTRAELWLPVARGAKVARVVTNAARPPAQTRPLTVLVVDDDPLVLMNTGAMLEDLGHNVVEVTSAGEALALLRQGQLFDLLITDHLMPGMTGAQLAQVLASEFSALPVLLATGFAQLADAADLNVAKISKPYRQEDLANAIGTVLPGDDRPSRVVPFRK
jgi:PAS domain S-box-containing protein